jgi:hypothetical protein
MKRKRRHQIISEGYSRERDASRNGIEQQVREEYAGRLAGAGFIRRLWIRLAMSREVRHRLDRAAPKDALYFRQSERSRRAPQ